MIHCKLLDKGRLFIIFVVGNWKSHKLSSTKPVIKKKERPTHIATTPDSCFSYKQQRNSELHFLTNLESNKLLERVGQFLAAFEPFSFTC